MSSFPRDYKTTEVGLIPENWEVIRLGDLLDFRNGVNADKDDYGKGIPFINVLEIITKSHLYTSDIPGRVSLTKNLVTSFSVHQGDIVFNRTSETQEDLGLASVYLGNDVIVFGGFVIRGRPLKQSIDAIYAGYVLRAPTVRSQITAKGQGAIRANIGQGDLRKILVPLPPLDEQRAIADALSEVDAQITALDEAIAKKRDLKQGAMQRLLTGQERLPHFSEAWREWSFNDLFITLKTASNPRSHLSDTGDVKYIHYGDIHQRWTTYLDCEKEELPYIDQSLVQTIPYVKSGDLIMADASEDYEGIGASVEVKNVGDMKVVAGLHTLLLRGNDALLADGFKGYLQYIPDVKRQLIEKATGISVYGISKHSIKSIMISLPDIDEQLVITTVLSDIDAEISALEEQREKTVALKQGMMQELLTGKTRLV